MPTVEKKFNSTKRNFRSKCKLSRKDSCNFLPISGGSNSISLNHISQHQKKTRQKNFHHLPRSRKFNESINSILLNQNGIQKNGKILKDVFLGNSYNNISHYNGFGFKNLRSHNGSKHFPKLPSAHNNKVGAGVGADKKIVVAIERNQNKFVEDNLNKKKCQTPPITSIEANANSTFNNLLIYQRNQKTEDRNIINKQLVNGDDDHLFDHENYCLSKAKNGENYLKNSLNSNLKLDKLCENRINGNKSSQLMAGKHWQHHTPLPLNNSRLLNDASPINFTDMNKSSLGLSSNNNRNAFKHKTLIFNNNIPPFSPYINNIKKPSHSYLLSHRKNIQNSFFTSSNISHSKYNSKSELSISSIHNPYGHKTGQTALSKTVNKNMILLESNLEKSSNHLFLNTNSTTKTEKPTNHSYFRRRVFNCNFCGPFRIIPSVSGVVSGTLMVAHRRCKSGTSQQKFVVGKFYPAGFKDRKKNLMITLGHHNPPIYDVLNPLLIGNKKHQNYIYSSTTNKQQCVPHRLSFHLKKRSRGRPKKIQKLDFDTEALKQPQPIIPNSTPLDLIEPKQSVRSALAPTTPVPSNLNNSLKHSTITVKNNNIKEQSDLNNFNSFQNTVITRTLSPCSTNSNSSSNSSSNSINQTIRNTDTEEDYPLSFFLKGQKQSEEEEKHLQRAVTDISNVNQSLRNGRATINQAKIRQSIPEKYRQRSLKQLRSKQSNLSDKLGLPSTPILPENQLQEKEQEGIQKFNIENCSLDFEKLRESKRQIRVKAKDKAKEEKFKNTEMRFCDQELSLNMVDTWFFKRFARVLNDKNLKNEIKNENENILSVKTKSPRKLIERLDSNLFKSVLEHGDKKAEKSASEQKVSGGGSDCAVSSDINLSTDSKISKQRKRVFSTGILSKYLDEFRTITKIPIVNSEIDILRLKLISIAQNAAQFLNCNSNLLVNKIKNSFNKEKIYSKLLSHPFHVAYLPIHTLTNEQNQHQNFDQDLDPDQYSYSPNQHIQLSLHRVNIDENDTFSLPSSNRTLSKQKLRRLSRRKAIFNRNSSYFDFKRKTKTQRLHSINPKSKTPLINSNLNLNLKFSSLTSKNSRLSKMYAPFCISPFTHQNSQYLKDKTFICECELKKTKNFYTLYKLYSNISSKFLQEIQNLNFAKEILSIKIYLSALIEENCKRIFEEIEEEKKEKLFVEKLNFQLKKEIRGYSKFSPSSTVSPSLNFNSTRVFPSNLSLNSNKSSLKRKNIQNSFHLSLPKSPKLPKLIKRKSSVAEIESEEFFSDTTYDTAEEEQEEERENSNSNSKNFSVHRRRIFK